MLLWASSRARADSPRLQRLVREQALDLDIEAVFGFFADAHNLEWLTPTWLRFQVLSPAPLTLREGSIIDYRLRLHGLPVRWRSEIEDWRPPRRFVDLQVRGPYRFWRHTHTFERLGRGTLVRDEVEYAVPGGRVVERWLVRPDLERIFDYRAHRLLQWAERTALDVAR
jgi:ligand-binding SRPBCC domain-containing protein